MKSRKTRRYLHQGGSSWTSAPVASALARKTGILTCKPPYLHLSPILLRADHQEAGQTAAKGHGHPHRSEQEGKSNLIPGLLRTLRRQLTGCSLQSPRETSYSHVGIPSAGRNSPPSPEPTDPEYQQGTGLLLWRRTLSG